MLHARRSGDAYLPGHSDPAEWTHIALCFKKRHVFAHRLGVMDEQYVRTANDPDAVAGRRVRLTKAEVDDVNRLLERIGDHLMQHLGL